MALGRISGTTPLAALLLLLLLFASVGVTTALKTDSQVEKLFEEFKQRHNKTYKTVEEELRRMSIFAENLRHMEAVAARNPHAVFSIQHSRFADLTKDEFRSRYLTARPKTLSEAKHHRVPRAAKEKLSKLPDAVDWRERGAVTPVKDQRDCASCWAFAVTGGIEGAWAAAGHPLVSLSEQYLLSCNTRNATCNGGYEDRVIDWLLKEQQGKVYTEASYPYTAINNQTPLEPCKAPSGPLGAVDPNLVVGAVITKRVYITPDEDAIAERVATSGPVVVGVDASSWKIYAGGILTSCKYNNITHIVLIVGYNNTSYPPYWIIKNSWGSLWGEQGYIRIEKGRNLCGIANYPISVEVEKDDGLTPLHPEPTLAPPSANKSKIVRTVYYDNNCMIPYKNVSYPLETCFKFEHDTWAIFYSTNGLLHKVFYSDSMCSGAENVVREALNRCVKFPFTSYQSVCI